MPSRARPPSPELTNLDCAFPPFPTMVSRSTTPVSDSRSQNSDKESIYVRTHAEPYNIPSSRRGSTSSSAPRKRSNTLGNNHESNRRPSTSAGDRRPSLANTAGGLRAGLPNVPPLPSPLFNVASDEAQSPKSTTGYSPALASQQLSGVTIIDKGTEKPAYNVSEPIAVSAMDSALLTDGNQEPQSGPNGPNAEEPQELQSNRAGVFELDGQVKKKPEVFQQQQKRTNFLPGFNGPSYRAKRPPSLSSDRTRDVSPGARALWEKPLSSPSRSQTFPIPSGDKPTADGRYNGIQRRPSEPTGSSQFPMPSSAAAPTAMENNAAPRSITTNVPAGNHSHHSPSDSASSYGTVNSVDNSVVPSRSSRSSQPSQETEALKTLDFLASRIEAVRPEAEEVEPLPPPKPIVDNQADSPTDPAFQGGRLTPIQPMPLQRTQTTPEMSFQRSPQTPKDVQQNAVRPTLLRSKTTGANKGQCRGCSKMIAANQKSVSSADGRLTGRYHKECFACTTCHSAFATADFYVLRDQPYCSQHYHALNGSLCGSCGRGIEGQYLEATRSKARGPEKFHAKCFTCVMCRVVLTHDYFEHHGRFFCEKDIHRVAGPPPSRSPNMGPGGRPGPGANGFLSVGNGRKFPERRSTKLMIMS